jgi:streptogramin lyase
MGNHAIRRIRTDGTIETIAGCGEKGYSGDGGPAREARLNEPYEVRFGSRGELVFVEMQNHVVRMVDPRSGTISTLAGTGEEGFTGDGGPATAARMNQPHSIQYGRDGALYICDIGNHRVRRIDPATGTIDTFCGNGERDPTPDGAAAAPGTPLNGPRALDIDAKGDLWLALREGNAVYRIDMAAKRLHHVAGTGKPGFTGNGGPARDAELSGPKGISVAPDGNVYLADTESHSIRFIDLSVSPPVLRLLAGTGEAGDGPDGEALRCRFARPHGIFVDRDESVLVGDSENHRVRIIRPE